MLISLLTVGPYAALFTARWRRTASITLLASIAVVGAWTVAGAAVLERRGASP